MAAKRKLWQVAAAYGQRTQLFALIVDQVDPRQVEWKRLLHDGDQIVGDHFARQTLGQ